MHDCCGTDSCSPPRPAPADRTCRQCGRKGLTVARQTLENLLKPEAARRLQASPYAFDSNPDCPVVYFSNEADSCFYKNDLSVRVGVKERHDPIPVCYCFGHTRESIEREILRSGESTVFDEVTRQVQAGECACEIRNPSGRCCLGDISRTVRSIENELKDQPTA